MVPGCLVGCVSRALLAFAHAHGWECDVSCGIMGATAENLSLAGTLKTLKQYPKIKLAGQLYGIFQAQTSEKVTATLGA